MSYELMSESTHQCPRPSPLPKKNPIKYSLVGNNLSDTIKSVIIGKTTIFLHIKHTQPKISLFALTKGCQSKHQL